MTDALRSSRFLLSALLTLVVTLAWNLPVTAAGGAAADQAREHHQRGEAYFKLEKFKEALTEFETAYLAKPEPRFLFNIGECHRVMGDKASAVRFYKRFLKYATPGPSQVAAEQRVREIEGTPTRAVAPSPAPPAPARAVTPPPAPAAPPPPAPPARTVVPPPPLPARAVTPAPPAPVAGPAVPSAPPPAVPSAQASAAPILVSTPAGDPATPAAGQPIYARWWFWTAVAVVAVGGAVAIWSVSGGPECEAGRACQ